MVRQCVYAALVWLFYIILKYVVLMIFIEKKKAIEKTCILMDKSEFHTKYKIIMLLTRQIDDYIEILSIQI